MSFILGWVSWLVVALNFKYTPEGSPNRNLIITPNVRSLKLEYVVLLYILGDTDEEVSIEVQRSIINTLSVR